MAAPFAILNAQVRVAICIASDGLSNFHPVVVVSVIMSRYTV